MSAQLSDFHDLIIPEVPTCPTPLVNLHLLETARHFCHATSAWRLPFDDITLVPGVADYDLSPSELDSEVVRVIRLTRDGLLLWDEANRDAQDRPRYSSDEPPFSVSNELTTLTLGPCEVNAGPGLLQVIGAMKPTRKATRLPDFLLGEYREAMRIGTLARLFDLAGQPWTDRAKAMDLKREMQQQLGFAGYQASVGNTRQRMRVKSWG